jgi:hypothetical protein
MRPMSFTSLAAALVISGSIGTPSAGSAEGVGSGQAGAPDFGPNVLIFDPSMRDIQSRIDAVFTINSSNVVGDNFWLWRADHGRGVGWTRNRNESGLVVNGNDVTIYGLFVEHCQGYQTVWDGNGGRVYFYQSEMPCDPPSQEAWRHGDVDGYASYKVGDAVTTHEAWGLGVYCVFNAAPVVAGNAIETPAAPGVKMHHMVTIRLAALPWSPSPSPSLWPSPPQRRPRPMPRRSPTDPRGDRI